MTTTKLLLTNLVSTLLFTISACNLATAQTNITTIDGVYIETDSAYLSISDHVVRNGDIFVFDIPGVYDYMMEHGIVLRNVVMKIDDIELPEFPAYMLSSTSGLIMFKFSLKHLSTEHRKQLYNLKGNSTKEVLLGIKFNENNILTHNQRASIYFLSIKYWNTFSWSIIILLIVFFLVLVLKYKSLIKEGVKDLNVDSAYSSKYSFSKSQLAYWTFIVVGCFMYIWFFTGDLSSINTTALVLIGISAATTTAGQLINKDEENKARLKGESAVDELKNVKSTYKNFFTDILSDGGGLSIYRLQALVFNIAFGIAFMQSVIIEYSMPEFSSIQLGLLGVSNGTYAVIKKSEVKN